MAIQKIAEKEKEIVIEKKIERSKKDEYAAPADRVIMILFGATGDLANRKIFPALNSMNRQGTIPKKFRVIAIGRRDYTNDIFREKVKNSIEYFSTVKSGKNTDSFLKIVDYLKADFTKEEAYAKLKRKIEEEENESNLLYYLATSPDNFGVIAKMLKKYGLAHDKKNKFWRRVIIEKPFGSDIASAKRLNKMLKHGFPESRIFRIDHYLGKELVQNILVLRFTNIIFEQLWNQKYIDNVQITVAEDAGVGRRGGYYDSAGALRDMVQSHLLQLVSLIAMEPPVSLSGRDISSEKVKVFRSLTPLTSKDVETNIVRGQYSAGVVKGRSVKGYREEEGVRRDSDTETFVAMKLTINNMRWAGVPFYLRTGKRMKDRFANIIIQFKELPCVLFCDVEGGMRPNMLTIRIQPEEGMETTFNLKTPGSGMDIQSVRMNFSHEAEFGPNTPEAYEKLIYNTISGDTTLFTSWKEVEQSWIFIDPIFKVWRKRKPRFPNYAAGTMGPREADMFIRADGREWNFN